MSQATGGAFPATRPSVVRDLGSVDPLRRAAASEALARSYWRPVYVYIRLRWRRSPEDAQDLAQEFFTRALEREYLSLGLAIGFGLTVGLSLAFCVSLAQRMSGQPAYYWQIMLPDAILGIIVGYATFTHGRAATAR